MNHALKSRLFIHTVNIYNLEENYHCSEIFKFVHRRKKNFKPQEGG